MFSGVTLQRTVSVLALNGAKTLWFWNLFQASLLFYEKQVLRVAGMSRMPICIASLCLHLLRFGQC